MTYTCNATGQFDQATLPSPVCNIPIEACTLPDFASAGGNLDYSQCNQKYLAPNQPV